MTTHELARLLLAGPDAEVVRWEHEEWTPVEALVALPPSHPRGGDVQELVGIK